MRLLLPALLAFALAGCMSMEPAAPTRGQVTGNVTYLERAPLPRPGTLRVTLEDVTDQNDADVIAEQRMSVVGEFGPPFPFTVEYDLFRIRRDRTYVMRAELRDPGGELRATSIDSYPVLTRGASNQIDVRIRVIGAAPEAPVQQAPAPAAQPPAAQTGEGGHNTAELRAAGIDFRAVGNEPGWLLDMYADRLVLSYDYGNNRIEAARPAPTYPAYQGEIYTIASPQRMRITIRRTPCQDVMSGEPYPARVTVELDGRVLEGCGRSI